MAKSILVVDDSKTQLKIISRIIAAEGFAVDTADSGSLALSTISKTKYDLVLTDLEMPNVDGAELLRHIAVRQPGQAVGVISGRGPNLLKAAMGLAKLHGLTLFGAYEKPLSQDSFVMELHRFFERQDNLAQQAAPASKGGEQLDLETVKAD